MAVASEAVESATAEATVACEAAMEGEHRDMPAKLNN